MFFLSVIIFYAYRIGGRRVKGFASCGRFWNLISGATNSGAIWQMVRYCFNIYAIRELWCRRALLTSYILRHIKRMKWND